MNRYLFLEKKTKEKLMKKFSKEPKIFYGIYPIYSYLNNKTKFIDEQIIY